MNIQLLILHLICLSAFIYFVVPISIEYFNFTTITTTYLSQFYPNLPQPTLQIIYYAGDQDSSSLGEIIMVNQFPSMMQEILDNSFERRNFTLNIPDQISKSHDLLIWWDLPSRSKYNKLIKRCRLRITYENSPDIKEMRFSTLYGISTISIQLFGDLPKPFGTCLTANGTCYRVRFTERDNSINSLKLKVNILNSLSMIHVPSPKFTLSSYAILVLGLIGLFSDITAISVIDSILNLVVANLTKFCFSIKIRQILIYFILLILCCMHIAQITNVYNRYDIQSAMYEGPPMTNDRNIRADICEDHKGQYYIPSPTMNDFTESLNIFDEHSFDSVNFWSQDGMFCATGMRKNRDKDDQESIYLLQFDWHARNWTRRVYKAYDSSYESYLMGAYKMKVTVNRAMTGQFCDSKSTFDIIDSTGRGTGTYQYRLLHVTATFMEYPYVTKCRNIYNEKSCQFQDYLSCGEGKYIYQNFEKTRFSDDELSVKVTAQNHGIDIQVSSSMTLFDYISCLSTVIGFWLGLSILGSAEMSIECCKMKRYLFLFVRFVIWFILLIATSYFIFLKFEEYFKYDVSTAITYHDTPDGILLPRITFRFTAGTNDDGRKDPWVNKEKIFFPRSSKDGCKNVLESCKISNNSVSILDSNMVAKLSNNCKDFRIKCHMHLDKPLISADIGNVIGKWDEKHHKYIIFDRPPLCNYGFDDVYHGSASLVSIIAFPSVRDFYSIYENDLMAQLDYLNVKLLKLPYRTQCQDYRDPTTYSSSWYYNLMNGTMIDNRIHDGIITSEDNDSPRYYIYGKYKWSEFPIDALKYILKERLKLPCHSITSVKTMVKSIKPPGRFATQYIVEPRSTVSMIASPKIRPIDFFILLFDQIGFWLGINFVFICFIPIRLIWKLKGYCDKNEISDEIDTNSGTIAEKKTDQRNDFIGKRMNTIRYWKKYSQDSKKIRKVGCSMDGRKLTSTCHRPVSSQIFTPRIVLNHERTIASAPGIRIKNIVQRKNEKTLF